MRILGFSPSHYREVFLSLVGFYTLSQRYVVVLSLLVISN